jgi:hypothetical protein
VTTLPKWAHREKSNPKPFQSTQNLQRIRSDVEFSTARFRFGDQYADRKIGRSVLIE